MKKEGMISLKENEKCKKLIVLVADVYYVERRFFKIYEFVGK
jgi:hypothetical protein